MAHHRDHRGPRQLHVVGIGSNQFFKLFLRHHLFKGHEGHFITEPLSQLSSYVVVQSLVDRGEHAALQQQGHNVFGLDAQLLREFFYGRAFNQTYRLQLARLARGLHPAGDAIFKRQGLWRRNEIATIELATLSFSRSPSGTRSSPARAAPAGIRRRNVGCLRSKSFTRRAGTFGARVNSRRANNFAPFLPFTSLARRWTSRNSRRYDGRGSPFTVANTRVKRGRGRPHDSDLS